jgi:hypothetical protein
MNDVLPSPQAADTMALLRVALPRCRDSPDGAGQFSHRGVVADVTRVTDGAMTQAMEVTPAFEAKRPRFTARPLTSVFLGHVAMAVRYPPRATSP